jgi:hypothetical protein
MRPGSQESEPGVVECADIYAAAPDDERSDGPFVVLGADRQRGVEYAIESRD